MHKFGLIPRNWLLNTVYLEIKGARRLSHLLIFYLLFHLKFFSKDFLICLSLTLAMFI
ncbi:hypothetical protein HMPREF0352_0319 [Enterococcus faecium TX1330]|nr:hypothetical protein HMPREF0352_0319 [Enterococcus faecium TX1330]